jgi:hypothetical protein
MAPAEFLTPASEVAGGHTYLTILKMAWSANFKMVYPPATIEAGARRPAIIQLEQFKEASSKPSTIVGL